MRMCFILQMDEVAVEQRARFYKEKDEVRRLWVLNQLGYRVNCDGKPYAQAQNNAAALIELNILYFLRRRVPGKGVLHHLMVGIYAFIAQVAGP